ELPTQRGARLLAHDRDHRLVIELGVVQTIQKVDGAGTGSRQAHADLAAELGMRARHERAHLFVPRPDQLELVAGAVQRAHQAIDAVTGITVDASYAP